jgi:fructose-bisphosphate aldolase class II
MAEAALKSSAAGLKPGVVTGENYKTLVDACKSGGYALPAVNVSSSHTVNGVLEAAAKNKSDIIIQLSNGGAQFYAGQGFPDGTLAKVLGAVSAARHVHMMAEHYGVCVVLHTDHANKKLIPWVESMLDHGEAFFKETGKPLFSSHMLDLSEEPIEWNLNECARVLKRMAPMGMSLEIELGVTGGEEDGIGGEFDESADNSKLYTQPEDVLQAYEKLQSIGMFWSLRRSATSTASTSRATSSCARRSSRSRRSWWRSARAPRPTRCTWCSTAARARKRKKSPRRSATACSR